MKHVFVINPVAGKKDQTEVIKKAVESRNDIDYIIYNTTEVGDATRYVKELASSNPNEFYRFYACGGDGTISEVVNGLIGLSNVSFSCYPCGSGNDFIKASKGNFKDINALIDGETVDIDLIKCNGEYCVNMVNVGFDAAVSYNMLKFKHWPLVSGKTAYNLALVYSLIKEMKHKAKIYVDDKLNYEGNFLLTAASNGICCGGGYYFTPHALIDDGYIDQLTVKSISRMKFIAMVKNFKNGTYESYPKLMNYLVLNKCKKLHVESEKEIIYAIDGNTNKAKVVDVEIVAKAIKFVRPIVKEN